MDFSTYKQDQYNHWFGFDPETECIVHSTSRVDNGGTGGGGGENSDVTEEEQTEPTVAPIPSDPKCCQVVVSTLLFHSSEYNCSANSVISFQSGPWHLYNAFTHQCCDGQVRENGTC